MVVCEGWVVAPGPVYSQSGINYPKSISDYSYSWPGGGEEKEETDDDDGGDEEEEEMKRRR